MFTTLIITVMVELSVAMFVPTKDYIQETQSYQYKTMGQDSMIPNDGPNSQIQIRQNSPNSYIVIRNEPSGEGLKVRSEIFTEPVVKLLHNSLWQKEDSDVNTRSMENLNKHRFQGGLFDKSSINSFILDSEKLFRQNKNDLFQPSIKFSDQTSERRVYGIRDFVKDFLKIVETSRLSETK